MVLKIRDRPEPMTNHQNNSAHKRSSASHSRQNQLAKMPRQHEGLEREVSRVLTNLLGHGACQLGQMHDSVPARKSVHCRQCWAGERQRGSPPKMVPAAAGKSVPNHLSGSSGSSKPSGHVIMMAALLWGKPRGARYRESTASHGHQKLT